MKVEEIIYKFKARIKEGKSIKYKDFKNDDSKLLYAIERKIENLKSDKVEFINYEFYLNKLDEKSRQRFILEFDAIINSQC